MFKTSFYLKPKPPFRLDLTVWALRRLPHNIIDQLHQKKYTRIFMLGSDPVRVDITQPDDKRILVTVEVDDPRIPDFKPRIISLLETVLGIRKDLKEFYSISSRDPHINPLVNRFMGLKPPRFPSLFEAVVNAIAFQQLSLNVGVLLLNRVAETYGRKWTENGKVLHAFPGPPDFVKASTTELRKLGFSINKATSILSISEQLLEGTLDLERSSAMDDAQAADFLGRLRGIGSWSAEYVLLRGLGRLNIFPGADVGARNSLQLLLRLANKPDLETIRTTTSRWHPFAGFIYFHFLLNRLKTKGYL